MNSKRTTLRICPGIRMAGMVLLLLLTSTSLWAEVRATLNRHTIQDGESVTLLVEASGKDTGGEPDLSVLERDFEILGSSTSQQIQFLNGKRSDKRQWQIELLPLHAGVIEVPALAVGGTQTRPLKLTVTDLPASGAAGADQPVFLKAVVEPASEDTYVQQQLNYTLQLYFREPLLNGSFEGPNIEQALVERLGEDVRYATRVNGIDYQVIERRYAIFPEVSGELLIPEVVFTGQLRAGSARRLPGPGMDSLLDDFMSGTPFGRAGKRIRVRSEPQTLEIKPQPAAYSGSAWLPAAALELHDSWAEDPPEFRVGEPVTRTLTLAATGLEGSQLPTLSLADMPGMRLYPEQPLRENRTDGKWVYGSSRQSLAYVPATSGKLSIPEIRIDWWDTSAQQQRSALLPGWEINVQPGAAAVAQPSPAPVSPPVAKPAEPAATAASEAPQGSGWREAVQAHWHWLAGLVLLTSGGIVLLRLAARARRQTAAATADTPVTTGNRQRQQTALAALQQACRGNNPQAAARALLQLAEAEWPADPPRNLEALARRLAAGAGPLRALERALYAAGNAAWEGDELWELFRNGLPAEQADNNAADPALAPLYPDWDKQRGET